MRYRTIIVLLWLALITGTGCSGLLDHGPSIPSSNTLVLFDHGPMTLDPAMSQDVSSHIYVTHIYSGLVGLDNDMQSSPELAESWDVSPDSLTYTFHLRPDAAFHDGRPITATDLKYSWERACRPETGSPTAPTYLNDIVGVSEMLQGEADSLSGVRVLDDHTLQVTINAPKAHFLAKLTYPVAYVVDKLNVESGKDWWRKPNGSGPFRLRDWDTGKLILLQRNDRYYGESAKLDHVAFLLSGGVPMRLYEKGDIDVTHVSLSHLDRVLDPTSPFLAEFNVFPELSLMFIGFDTTKPPFDDVRMRRALAQAVDKERLANQIFMGTVVPAYSILPPGMPGWSRTQAYSYDLEEARTLVQQAGYGPENPMPLANLTMTGEGGRIGQWLTSIMWEWTVELELELGVRQLDSEAYFDKLGTELDQMFFYGWVADYPDPQNFLEVLFGTGSINNVSGYSNSEVDRLLAAAAIEADTETRLGLYRQAEEILMDEAACIPLWFNENHMLIKPYVKDFSLNPLGVPRLAQVSLTK